VDLIAQPPEISALVRKIRLEKGMTMQELASKSGVERSFLSRLERGHREWTVDTLDCICRGLGEKIFVLFG